MNYYEELGLHDRASAEEIKDAYRALMRLLHPDHVQDPDLRRVADTQVKKINRVYETLSDPERRRRYDLELVEGDRRVAPIIFHAPPPPRKKLVTRSSALWVGAVSAFAILLIWMASRQAPPVAPDYSSGASIVEPEPSRTPPLAAPAPAPAPKPVNTESPVKNEAPAAPARNSSAELEASQLRDQLARAMNERDAALAEVAHLRSQPVEKAQAAEKPRIARLEEHRQEEHKPEAPKREVALVQPSELPRQQTAENQLHLPIAPPVQAAKPPQPLRNPIAGSWIYRPADSPSRNKDLYPPEFIETYISEDHGEVRGTYRARYHVLDRPVAPEVSFQFSGKLTGDSGSLPWSGNGGSRGEVTFRLMADHSLKVDWVASQLGALGFYKGTAVLVKRSE
jgi:hypothetical protein